MRVALKASHLLRMLQFLLFSQPLRVWFVEGPEGTCGATLLIPNSIVFSLSDLRQGSKGVLAGVGWRPGTWAPWPRPSMTPVGQSMMRRVAYHGRILRRRQKQAVTTVKDAR
ncbi:hypothetical protein GGR53DRAFT_277480 [Hypoxylon sp. FL1150]|nr:hypothetical protein GGR53DRAFT_277480 [Hypoxylon sp. FL1150]